MKLFLLFATLIAVSAARHSGKKPDHVEEAEHTAVVNDLADHVLSLFKIFVRENELDPMNLPDVEENFSVKPIFITYSGELSLTEGKFFHLSAVERHGDVKLTYGKRVLRLYLQLNLPVFQSNYDYFARLLHVKVFGNADVFAKNAKINVVAKVDLNTMEASLEEVTIDRLGHISIDVSTDIAALDLIVSGLSSAVTNVFKEHIINSIEKEIERKIGSFVISLRPHN